MRIVFMGTPDIAVATLKRVHEAGHEVVCVVTQPDKPYGRKKTLTPPPVKEAALELGIPVLQPSSVNRREVREHIRSLNADVAVVVAFGQILRKGLLEGFRHGCVNVHGSLLPRYRGAAPIQRAVMDGESETGVTIMRMDEGLDTGPVILVRTLPIDRDETAGELFVRMAEVGAEALVDALRLIETGTAVLTPQQESGSTYAAKLTDEDGRINWTDTAVAIHNRVRGLNPAPGASTNLEGMGLKIWRTRLSVSPPAPIELPSLDQHVATPGIVVAVSKSGVVVQTGLGLVELLEVQPSGGKRMGAADFARGKRINAGSCRLI